jgi:hypothetical protein
MNGNDGKIPKKDNGGDLVETSFLCQGLLTVREYFKDGNTTEKALKADELWKGWNGIVYKKEARYTGIGLPIMVGK